MSADCVLKIKTPDFSVQLEGDADFVHQGYQAIRGEIIERLRRTSEQIMASDTVVMDSVQVVTPEMLARGPAAPPSKATSEAGYVWIYRCNDLYNKVHVVERAQLAEHKIGRFVDAWQIVKVYLESEHASSMGSLVPLGKTIWSELTIQGRQRLRKQ